MQNVLKNNLHKYNDCHNCQLNKNDLECGTMFQYFNILNCLKYFLSAYCESFFEHNILLVLPKIILIIVSPI